MKHIFLVLVLLVSSCNTIPEGSEPSDSQQAFLNATAYHYGLRGKDKSYSEAAKWYELSIQDGDVESINCYAFFLATANDPAYRDGERALELMNSLSDEARSKHHILDTEAAVHAELGNFDLATKIQSGVVKTAPKGLSQSIKDDLLSRYISYTEGKPWRE